MQLRPNLELDKLLMAAKSIEQVTVVSIIVRVAVESAQLPGDLRQDPADRSMVALAREPKAALLTADEKIRNYPHTKASSRSAI